MWYMLASSHEVFCWNPLAKREAQPLLANVYHYYRMPLPFDKQDNTAERVKW
jgi:hypothetical protein